MNDQNDAMTQGEPKRQFTLSRIRSSDGTFHLTIVGPGDEALSLLFPDGTEAVVTDAWLDSLGKAHEIGVRQGVRDARPALLECQRLGRETVAKYNALKSEYNALVRHNQLVVSLTEEMDRTVEQLTPSRNAIAPKRDDG